MRKRWEIGFFGYTVRRNINGQLETDVYHKPTHTDKYLFFFSHYSRSHKKSIARTLLIVNSGNLFESMLYRVLATNGYLYVKETKKRLLVNNLFIIFFPLFI